VRGGVCVNGGIVDTGFLLAVIDAADNLHAACVAALESETNPILSDVVLPELAYLILRELGYSTLGNFLRAVVAGELAQAQSTPQDLSRAADLLEKYADNKVDFVDCAIVAMAERLKITKVLTVDKRHFTMFRPQHCEYFEIAP
jgi:uncharacterized protein